MYGTVADWRSWAQERGHAAPVDAPEADASAALTRASDYIRYKYVNRMSQKQELPGEVEEATYHVALIELQTPGFFGKTYSPGERKVMTEAEGVKWTLLPDAEDSAAPVSTAAELLLRPYLFVLPGVMAV